MLTANVLRRVFQIQYKNSIGTAFTIDIKNRQYLITARHVVENIIDNDSISLKTHDTLEFYKIRIVGKFEDNLLSSDIIVLSLDSQISPSFSMTAGHENLVWGQNIFFLGYPFGLFSNERANGQYPLPIIKGGLMSGRIWDTATNGLFLIDGHNNPGFSGGPVVFQPANNIHAEFRVLGIVSAYRTERSKVMVDGSPTELSVDTNTGIVLCPAIDAALNFIEKNPIGAKIVF